MLNYKAPLHTTKYFSVLQSTTPELQSTTPQKGDQGSVLSKSHIRFQQTTHYSSII